jgi:acetylornithine deacetylase/succinyl-diaminopimelate desuccinylase-like protein
MDAATTAAVTEVERRFAETRGRLERLVEIPSCSFPGFDHAHVERSAEATRAWLGDAGFPEVRIVRLPGVLPYVIAKDHRAGPSRPTLALYAHHDVQPPLREHLWRTPPFKPTEIGGRLYARGAADDKGGIAVHAAAAAAWNATAGRPPVNLTVVVEGEEEVGSEHFSQFLDTYADELRADCVVIADLQNFDAGLPSLTTSLRGMVALQVELRALRAPVHSGIWGGAVPDPTLALCAMLASLSDGRGGIAIPGIAAKVRPPTRAEAEAYARLPYDRARFAEQAGMRAELLPSDGATLWRRLWREPALSVNAIQAGTRGQTGNVVMDAAWARVGIRIVPDMDPRETCELLEAHLRARVPAGMELTIERASLGSPWASSPDHAVFDLAREALRAGYGKEAVYMGCGASIPFVAEFTEKLGGIPALLVGVEDPECGAHSENESVHLGDLLSAMKSEAALFGLIASRPDVFARK